MGSPSKGRGETARGRNIHESAPKTFPSSSDDSPTAKRWLCLFRMANLRFLIEFFRRTIDQDRVRPVRGQTALLKMATLSKNGINLVDESWRFKRPAPGIT